MTCHVAMLGQSGGIMFSDSQGSTERAEMHGFQKQYAGPDFLVGGAGSMDGIFALFEALDLAVAGGLTQTKVEGFIEAWAQSELTERGRATVQFILVTGNGVSVFEPATFRRFRPRGPFGSIGSGSEFVWSAMQRDNEMGIRLPRDTLGRTMVTVQNYLTTANHSLTVNDRFLVGILPKGNVACLTGDGDIRVSIAPVALKGAWSEASARFSEMIALAEQTNSELLNAHQVFSAIALGQLSDGHVAAIQMSGAAIHGNVQNLDAKIAEYVAWYKTKIGMAPPTSAAGA